MTGPEHFQAAERLCISRSEIDVAKAQVHATLALAAATALSHVNLTRTADGSPHLPLDDANKWMDVASDLRKDKTA